MIEWLVGSMVAFTLLLLFWFMTTDLYRIAPSIPWWERIISGVGYILTRGAVLAFGGAAVFLGYAWGWGDGGDAGFLAGCRATTTDVACLRAQDLGNSIRDIRHRATAIPSRALTSAESGKIEVLCDDLRDGLSRRAAEHYGCVIE